MQILLDGPCFLRRFDNTLISNARGSTTFPHKKLFARAGQPSRDFVTGAFTGRERLTPEPSAAPSPSTWTSGTAGLRCDRMAYATVLVVEVQRHLCVLHHFDPPRV